LCNGIVAILSLVLRRQEFKNIGFFIEFTGGLFFYCYPIFNGIFVFNVQHFSEDLTYSQVRSWIFLEIVYFFTWFLSLMIFINYAYFFKYKSIWKRQYDINAENDIKNTKELFRRATIREKASSGH